MDFDVPKKLEESIQVKVPELKEFIKTTTKDFAEAWNPSVYNYAILLCQYFKEEPKHIINIFEVSYSSNLLLKILFLLLILLNSSK